MSNEDLKELFDRLKLCFPEEKRRWFREPVTAAEPMPSIHAQRWFEVTDGQVPGAWFLGDMRLVSRAESRPWSLDVEVERDGCPRESMTLSCVTIAEAASGERIMINHSGQMIYDPGDGRRDVVFAESASAWLEELLEQFISGGIVRTQRGLETRQRRNEITVPVGQIAHVVLLVSLAIWWLLR
ncbi:MAG: hypothetical protein H6716_17175 [Polyangiaceae bacterium]|nr:hypothetical protein [Polyangiaceae bacterium]